MSTINYNNPTGSYCSATGSFVGEEEFITTG